MALQVWLPLNKDLRNQGLSNIEVANNGATFVNTEADSTRKVAAGKLGGCYSFDGNDYISFPQGYFGDEWSYCFWINVDSVTTNQNLGCCRTLVGGGFAVWILTESGGKMRIDSGGLTTGQQWKTNYIFSLNTWVHVTITSGSNNIVKYYINGEFKEQNTITNRGKDKWGSTFAFGASTGTNDATTFTTNYFHGKLNDLRIYDHCLSPKEVKEISKGLVLHYKMNGTVENSENLTPFFSHPLDDISSGFYNETYWVDWSLSGHVKLLDCIDVLSDGWVHFEYAHSNTTTNREFVLFPPILDNFGAVIDGQYTVVLEIKNFQGENIGSGNLSNMSARGLKVYGSTNNGGLTASFFRDMVNQLTNGEGIFYLPCYVNGLNYAQNNSASNLVNYWLCPVFIFFPNEKVSFDFRLSAYEGEYTGPYRPYIEKNLLSNSDGPFTGIVNDSTNNDFGSWPNAVEVSAYDTYRVTFEAKASVENVGLMVYLFNNSSNIVQCASSTNNQNYTSTQTDGLSVFNLTTKYLTYHVIWKFNNNITPAFKRLLFRLPDPTHSSLNTDYVGETAEIRNVHLEKISGNEPDCSGYNNDGEYTGTPTLYSDTAKYDASTKLTAAFDYVRCGRGGMVSDGITVNMWIKCDAWGANPISCTEGGGWNFENNGGYIQFACYVAGIGYKSVKSSATIDSLLGGWHMLTGIYDGRYTKIYVDGVLKGSLDTGSDNHKIAYHAANAIFIGAEASGNALAPATNSAFIGNISDVRIYATPLNEADILELYHTGASVDNNANLFTGEVVE